MGKFTTPDFPVNPTAFSTREIPLQSPSFRWGFLAEIECYDLKFFTAVCPVSKVRKQEGWRRVRHVLSTKTYPKFGGAYRSLASTVNRSQLTDLPITKKTTRRPSRSKALEANVKAEEENLILVDSSQSSRVTFDLASAAWLQHWTIIEVNPLI